MTRNLLLYRSGLSFVAFSLLQEPEFSNRIGIYELNQVVIE